MPEENNDESDNIIYTDEILLPELEQYERAILLKDFSIEKRGVKDKIPFSGLFRTLKSQNIDERDTDERDTIDEVTISDNIVPINLAITNNKEEVFIDLGWFYLDPEKSDLYYSGLYSGLIKTEGSLKEKVLQLIILIIWLY
ncbi:MAG: hypothetical protein ACOX05_04645 [Bacillota bacterium]